MKVLTVCGMGMGTSLMVLMEIEAIAKKHGYDLEGEAVDLGSARGTKCDFIVASTEIAAELGDMSVPVISIRNILDKKEIEDKVLPIIKNI